ncbi:glutathione S-transferase [Pseudanabaena sp. ABRG5-3]|uniref:glutathione S-transferase n=1 Tax=Pseudanabaena sp. ABRG5-3 TaxID=685565 RepID=UPI000DC720CD|nr:glutathione S-transferase [Pseudanabaena sp. ABRG5-3]BBC24211.1 glutathione S-transferase domain protein [Pseudanabaena sp. ABRG5-3]
MTLPILYSFRRCPYAIRARMALAYAGIVYELREVSLKNKPKEMLEISPKGTTPVMQIFKDVENSNQDSDQGFLILEESLDIMNWAVQQNDPCNWQNLADADLAIAQQLIKTNDGEFKKALDRYKYPNRFPEQSQEFYRQQAEKVLQVLELQLQQHQFLIGDRQTLADVAIFPFIRQFAYVNIDWFNSSPYISLQKWLHWHATSAIFEFVMQKFPVWTPEQEKVIISQDFC